MLPRVTPRFLSRVQHRHSSIRRCCSAAAAPNRRTLSPALPCLGSLLCNPGINRAFIKCESHYSKVEREGGKGVERGGEAAGRKERNMEEEVLGVERVKEEKEKEE